MIWKRIGRQVLNGVDELAGSFKVNRAVRSAVKEGGEEAAKNASKAAKEIGEDVAERVGKRNAANQAEQAVKSEAKKTYNQAVHGVNEARKTTSDAAKNAANNVDDSLIRFEGKNGTIYERRRNPNWQEGNIRKSKTNPYGRNQYLYTADGASISGKDFGSAKKDFVESGGKVTTAEDIQKQAQKISETAAGDNAGFDLMQFAADHPVGTALAGLGVGVVGANLLDND